MDRIVSRRRPFLLALAILVGLGHGPAATSLARRPNLSDMPAGDPGDGVLRPFESEPYEPAPSSAQTEAAGSATVLKLPLQYVLVPVAAPAGQPWPVVFRLVRIGSTDTAPAWRPFPTGGRWHRAP